MMSEQWRAKIDGAPVKVEVLVDYDCGPNCRCGAPPSSGASYIDPGGIEFTLHHKPTRHYDKMGEVHY